MEGSKTYYSALTGVRALAAYMVFVHHFVPNQNPEIQGFLSKFLGEFHIGVSFFFVLSGFLIHNKYSTWFTSGTQKYWQYFSARLIRIMPLFIILSAFTFLFNFYFHKTDQGLLFKNIHFFILNVSLLKGLSPDLKFTGIPQTWTLTVEFCFYGIAPFLFLKAKNYRTWPLISVFLLGLGSILAYFLNSGFDYENLHFVLTYTFLGRSFEFFAGCYLSTQLAKWPPRKPANGFFTYAGFGLVIAVISGLTIGHFFLQKNGIHLFDFCILNLALPIAILLFYKGLLLENTFISQLLGSSIGQLLGKSSFAFYLIHVGFIELGLFHFVTENIFLLFLILNLISILLYLWVEKPLQKFFQPKHPKISPSKSHHAI